MDGPFTIIDESVKINKQLYTDFNNRESLTLNVEYVCPSIGYLRSVVSIASGTGSSSIYIRTYDSTDIQQALDYHAIYFNSSITSVKNTLVFKGMRLLVTAVRGTAEASFVPLIYK